MDYEKHGGWLAVAFVILTILAVNSLYNLGLENNRARRTPFEQELYDSDCFMDIKNLSPVQIHTCKMLLIKKEGNS